LGFSFVAYGERASWLSFGYPRAKVRFHLCVVLEGWFCSVDIHAIMRSLVWISQTNYA
jgi:hypothetical protein